MSMGISSSSNIKKQKNKKNTYFEKKYQAYSKNASTVQKHFLPWIF